MFVIYWITKITFTSILYPQIAHLILNNITVHRHQNISVYALVGQSLILSLGMAWNMCTVHVYIQFLYKLLMCIGELINCYLQRSIHYVQWYWLLTQQSVIVSTVHHTYLLASHWYVRLSILWPSRLVCDLHLLCTTLSVPNSDMSMEY